MARPFKVDLATEGERQALIEMAIREYRAPSDQAAYLIVDGLRRAGALPPEQKTAGAERQPAEAAS